jgi:hypothetical protein
MCCVPYERVENGERQTDGLGKGLENAIYLRLFEISDERVREGGFLMQNSRGCSELLRFETLKFKN